MHGENSTKQNDKNAQKHDDICRRSIALNIIVYIISILYNLTGSPYFTIYENTTILIVIFGNVFNVLSHGHF